MTAVLVTIPISHYCEKARWALERAGIPYREEAHPPFLHMLATRGGGGRSTPQLRLPGETLTDSPAILRYAERTNPTGLYPVDPSAREAVEALEKRLDDVFGPAVRRYAYHHLLDRFATIEPLLTQGVTTREKLAFRAISRVVPWAMRRAMRIDARTAERSRGRILETLDDVDARLADGRPYLLGDRFTAADLTFAALAAPMVAPPEHPLRMPPLADMPDALRRDVEDVRARPSGALIRRLYANERAPGARPPRG